MLSNKFLLNFLERHATKFLLSAAEDSELRQDTEREKWCWRSTLRSDKVEMRRIQKNDISILSRKSFVE
jgi:hypothetical protein